MIRSQALALLTTYVMTEAEGDLSRVTEALLIQKVEVALNAIKGDIVTALAASVRVGVNFRRCSCPHIFVQLKISMCFRAC